MKKIISILICFVLVFSIVPISVFTVSALQSGDYTYTVTNSQATITGYTGLGGNVTIPSTLGGYSVISIDSYAFYSCKSLTSISIPTSVTSIGEGAFNRCSDLATISIPSSVTSIGIYAFAYCTGLNQFIVDSNNSFYCCLDDVLFNKSKTTLIQYPANKASNYVIPNSVTSIGSWSFADSKLMSISIPDSVTSINTKAFLRCTSLTSVSIPSSITSISEGMFSGCSGLTSVSIPTSVTSIGIEAFKSCSGLTSISIPTSVTSIGNSAFMFCVGLTSISIPSSVTKIDDFVFCGCWRVTSISIPTTVKSIGRESFSGFIYLTSVTIPNSVTSIGQSAFQGCTSLSSVYFLGNAPALGSSAFYNLAYPAIFYYISGKTGFTDSWDGHIKSTFIPVNAPIGLNCLSKTDNTVSLSWNSVDGATGYNIYSDGTKLNSIPITTTARDILNHCFAYFVLGNCPTITIRDNKETLGLNILYKENTHNQINIEEFMVGDEKFSIIHTKNFATISDKHLIHLCAHKREVQQTSLSGLMKNIDGKFINAEGEFVYSGYITGKFLDNNINRERTAFTVIDEDEANLFNDIAQKDILDGALPLINKYLKTEIEALCEEKNKRVSNYVQNINPKYRYLLKHIPDCVSNIPLILDDDKLELELFKQEQNFKLTLKEEKKEHLMELEKITDFEEYTEKTAQFMGKVSDIGKSSLVEYIIHRKTILEILENNLNFSDDEKAKYSLEKNLHEIIFPLQKTSDDIDYLDHNLWLIDEKLSYHYYLASDKSITSMEPIESDCRKEPDIIIFDPAFALTDDGKDNQLSNVTIVEFKRPGRTDKECVDQIIKYIQKIRSGKALDKKGRPIGEMNSDSLRFTCYIVCDIKGNMSDFLEGRNFRKTPNGMAFYQYFDNYNAYIEVLQYSQLIKDSKKRNKILFEKLFNQ